MGRRSAPLFSIVVIARDEAAVLPRLLSNLSSFQGRSGEILLLDTGSSDDTVALARESGCRVIEAPRRFRSALTAEQHAEIERRFAAPGDEPLIGNGDALFHFGAARQYANELAANEIVLQLDAGDEALAFDVDALDRRIEERGFAAFEYDQQYGDTILRIARFFDRRLYRWEGRVHEVPVQTAAAAEAKVIRCSDDELLVRHHRDDSKKRSYLPGLALQVLEVPEKTRWWHYLGRELLYENKHRSAIPVLEKHVGIGDAWIAERAQSLNFVGECYEAIGRADEAAASYRRAFELDPSRREPLLRLASLLSRNGDFAAAIPFAEQSLGIARTSAYPELAANYTWLPHSLLYWSYFWVPKIDKARAHWEEFQRLAPEHPFTREHARMFQS